ncbi:MAG: lipid II flippase MurJ [Planctomycetota bacterium]
MFRSMLSSAALVGAVTAGVKAVGFAKEIVVASHFGTSDVMDCFTSAFVLWSFVFGVLGGAMPDALVPVDRRVRKKDSLQASDQLAADITAIYLLKLLIVCAVVYFLAPLIIPFYCIEYSAEKQLMTLRLFRLLTPFAVFMGATLIFTMLLQANKRFLVSTLAPIFGPAAAILAILIGYNSLGIHSMVLGAATGSALTLVLLWYWYVREISSLPFHRFNPKLSANHRLVISASIPFLLSCLVQLSTSIVDTGMAAWLEPGSVSVRSFASRTCQIGLTLVATAITSAFYPYLADLVADQNWSKLRSTVLRFSALVVIFSIPLIAAIWLFAEPIVGLIYERGEFSVEDTVRVASVLRWLSLQIPFYILAILGARVNCAILASKFMLLSACVNIVVNMVLNYVLIRFAGMGVEGIALSTVITYAVSAIMLYWHFLRKISSC